jgi:hypothetical protein
MDNTEPRLWKMYKNRVWISSLGDTYNIVRQDKGLSTDARGGYKRLTTGELVHRLVYTLFVGDIPKKMVINHIDGNKTNNNFKNLEAVTHRENSRHNAQVLGCKYCDAKAKLTDSDVLDIIALLEMTEVSFLEIASWYNVSKVAIYKINLGQNYSRITKVRCNDYPLRSRGQAVPKRGEPVKVKI